MSFFYFYFDTVKKQIVRNQGIRKIDEEVKLLEGGGGKGNCSRSGRSRIKGRQGKVKQRVKRRMEN